MTSASSSLPPSAASQPLLQNILTNKDSHIYLHHRIEWIQPPPAAKIPFLGNSLLAKIRKVTAYALVTLGFLMTLAAIGSLSCQALGLQVGMLPIGFGDLFMPGLIAILTGFHLPKDEAKNHVRFRIPTAIPGLTFHVL